MGPGSDNRLELFLRDIPDTLHYTDDTEMAIGVAESLIQAQGLDPRHMASRFVANFNPYRGYGTGTISVIEHIRRGTAWQEANRLVFPEGSFGNGAAMRAAPIGLFFAGDMERLKKATMEASAITHVHPLAQEGALLIAAATACAVNELGTEETLAQLESLVTLPPYKEKLDVIRGFLDNSPAQTEVIHALGTGVAAHESAPTAIYISLKYGHDYLSAISYCVALGGDTDTIAAMAGAVTGARLGIGSLPGDVLARLEDRDRIEDLGADIHGKP